VISAETAMAAPARSSLSLMSGCCNYPSMLNPFMSWGPFYNTDGTDAYLTVAYPGSTLTEPPYAPGKVIVFEGEALNTEQMCTKLLHISECAQC